MTPLLQSLRKGDCTASLAGPKGGDIKSKLLPPVLFHGTVSYLVNCWKVRGSIYNDVSLISSVSDAARFASYKITGKRLSPDNGMVGNVRLSNFLGKIFDATLISAHEYNLMEKYNELLRGQVVQSLVLFDTERILSMAGHNPLCHLTEDEESPGAARASGIKLTWESDEAKGKRGLPFEVIIASLDVDLAKNWAEWRIFNQQLWDENFKVPPPQLGKMAAVSPSSIFGAAMVRLTSYLFEGKGKGLELAR